jgi:hypothetical protein
LYLLFHLSYSNQATSIKDFHHKILFQLYHLWIKPILFKLNSIAIIGTFTRVKNWSMEIVFHLKVYEPLFSFFDLTTVLKAYRIQKWDSQRFFHVFHLTLNFKYFRNFFELNFNPSLNYFIKPFARAVVILNCLDILQNLPFLDIYHSFSNLLNIIIFTFIQSF